MDVRENTAGRDRDRAQELVELLVVADGELDVARDDARLLVTPGFFKNHPHARSSSVFSPRLCLGISFLSQRWRLD